METATSQVLTAAILCWPIGMSAYGQSAGQAVRQLKDAPYPQQVCRQWTRHDGLPGDKIDRIWIDDRGRVLVRGTAGVAAWEAQKWRIVQDPVSPVARPKRIGRWPGPTPWLPVTVDGRDAHHRLWIGTGHGVARWTGRRWHTYHSRRWLPHDHVNDLCFDAEGAVWVATDGGVACLSTRQMTLEQKANQFQEALRARHTWRGLIRASRLERPGQVKPFTLPSSDNDGLWTALYVAAESFRYAATGEEAARQNATQSMEALLFLEQITGLPGFIARSYVPAGEGPAYGGQWHRSADGKWDWKADTSSDELDGHAFAWSVYYDLVADDAQRRKIQAVVRRVMDRIIDHGFYWVGPTGKPTTWGVWAPEQLNHNLKWIEERGLNSLECLCFLKVAHHITGDAKYHEQYERLIREHAYAMNTVKQKILFPPSAINHSDDELAFIVYYPLLRYEKDAQRRKIYGMSIWRSWEIERPERSGLFNFVYGSATNGPFDLPKTVAAMRDVPLDLVNWSIVNSSRRDISRRPDRSRGKEALARDVLPPSERRLMRWNGDPYVLDGGNNGLSEDDGTFFLLPYWMGRYHGFLKP